MLNSITNFVRGMSIVQLKKRSIKTMSSHMGFNLLVDKKDKFIGGVATILGIFFVILPLSILSISIWLNDQEPYISSIKFPFGFEGDFKREPRVGLDEMNTLIFMIKDYNDTTFRMQ